MRTSRCVRDMHNACVIEAICEKLYATTIDNGHRGRQRGNLDAIEQRVRHVIDDHVDV
jgi:hypothetical protein